MSSAGKKYNSQWDKKEEPQISIGDVREKDLLGRSGPRFVEKASEPGWFSPESNDRNGHRWSLNDGSDRMQSKHDLGMHSREPLVRSRGSRKHADMDDDYGKNSIPATEYELREGYSRRMSPGRDELRQLSRRHSPNNDWHRSRRSRSQSRSRSRSRSPVQGLRRQSGFPDRSRSRSVLSDQLCKDFAIGRCRRGSDCQFIHQTDQASGDSWDSRNRKARDSKYSVPHESREQPNRSGRRPVQCTHFLKGNCKWGASCWYAHDDTSNEFAGGSTNEPIRERANDRRDQNANLEHGSEREPRRSVDIPCKHFAVGNCRNGKYCRFFHSGGERLNSDRRLHDNRGGWGNESNDAEKLRRAPRLRDVGRSDTAKSSVDKDGKVRSPDQGFSDWSDVETGPASSGNAVRGDLTHNGKATDGNVKEGPSWKAGSVGISTGIAGPKREEKWLDDMEMSPDWNVQTLRNSSKEERGAELPNAQPLALKDDSKPTYELGAVNEAPGWRHDIPASVPPLVTEISYFQPNHNSGHGSTNHFPSNYTAPTEKCANTSFDLNVSNKTIPGSNQNSHISGPLTSPSLHVAAANQLLTPTNPSGCSRTNNLETNPLYQEKMSIGNSGSRIFETSQGISATPTQNLVSSEQLNQLTNISASLVHLLGKGPQLPQLYAALNPQNAMQVPSFANLERPAKLDSPVTILQSNQAVVFEKPYDPVRDSIELKQPDIGAQPSRIPPVTIGQNNSIDARQDKPPNNLKSSAGIDSVETRTSEKLPTTASYSLGQQKPEDNSEVPKDSSRATDEDCKKGQEHNKNAQGDEPLENTSKDGVLDESKKGKDIKGTRAFKFALVEFVKELLKPTWKEGRMDKDGYKNIVKKVVEKVTGTMQAASIPQTQEKIDSYISLCKPKLSKLVQAYVDKLPKSTN